MIKEFFKWDETYSVNIKEIDEQHKVLVSELNNLYSAFMNNVHNDIIEKIVQSLVDYAIYHFGTEEKYFHQFKFQYTKEHISEHNEFRKVVSSFQDKLEKNKGSLTFEVVNFLRDWLMKHIVVSDKKYITCFIENGIK